MAVQAETQPEQIQNWQREIAVEQLLGESSEELVRYWLQLYAQAEVRLHSGKRRTKSAPSNSTLVIASNRKPNF